MKKGLLCILLAIVMIVPLFTACQTTVDLTGEEVSIYTLYTIVDESTTKEAVIEVELALNRILFYRLNVILDLVMVTEDEYDKLIEDKFAEMEELALAKKDKNKNKDKNKSSSTDEVSEDVMTGDKVLKMLEEGKEIVLEEPRLDIFLVRGYDNYYELASQGKLAALDEKLNNEAKAIKSSIHSTLLNAAKVDNKTYGIPVNNAIGEYTYFVFDTELLNSHEIDPNTISSLEDLEGYLAKVKETNPDVVPLKNTAPNSDIKFLANDGFPAIINGGVVQEAYSNTALIDYFTMIARYKALGYIGDEVAEGEEDNARYAVRIEKGDKSTLTNTYPEDKYTYSLYSNPVATNESTIDNIFCVSEYVVSNELTDVMEIVTAINTDAQIMNILTYGVEKVHYDLNDDGEVERLNNHYIIDPNYSGNCFITYTVADDNNPDKWNDAIQQNQDAIVSPSLGFTQSLTKFKYKDGEKEIEIYEPDYIAVINTVIDKYYPQLMNGTAVLDKINYDEIYAQAKTDVENTITEKLNTLYEENVLKIQINAEIESEIIDKQGPAILAKVEKEVRDNDYEHAKEQAIKALKKELKKDNPSASDKELTAMAEEAVTEEMIAEKMEDEETLLERIKKQYDTSITNAIKAETDKKVGSAEYNARLEALKKTDAYITELNEMLAYDAPRQIKNKVNDIISEQIKLYTESIITDLDAAIGAAIDAFVEEYSEILEMDRDAILEKIGYIGVLKEGEGTADGETSDAETSDAETSDTSGEEGEDTENKGPLYESWYDFVFEAKLTKQYYLIFGDPSKTA